VKSHCVLLKYYVTCYSNDIWYAFKIFLAYNGACYLTLHPVLDEQAEVKACPHKRARTAGIIRFYVEIIRLFDTNGIASDLPLLHTCNPPPLGPEAALKSISPSYSEERGLIIRIVCQALIKSCVHCWAHGVDYHSHNLVNCGLNTINVAHPAWKGWRKLVRLPAGCCFFCGFLLKV
jgi:hypothetical protein